MAQFLISIQLEADAKSFCKGQFQETLSSELKRKQTKALKYHVKFEILV